MAARRALCSFLVLFVAVPLAAQWTPVPALNAPPSRTGFTLTPLPNGELLLFGGDIANPAATEWSWNGIAWTAVTTPVPRRHLHAMAVDESTGDLVLFGGIGTGGPLTDTWRFDGSTWTQVITPNAPPPLGSMSMARDPFDESMILIGFPLSGVFETWRFSQGDWTQLTGAVITQGAARVYHDSVRRELALFAADGTGVSTYRLSGGAWQQTGGAAALPGVTSNLMATFDRDRGRLVVLIPGLNNATYEWDGLSGSLSPSAVPPFSLFPAMAYQPARSETIHVETTGPLAVWRWAPEPVPLALAHGTPCQNAAFRLALAPGDSPQPGASHRLQAQGPNGSFLTFALLGFSHTSFSGLPLPAPIPIGALGCLLRVEPTIITFLGTGLPAQLQISLPNSPSLLGQRYDAQGMQFDATGVLDTTNGLEVQIGLPLAQNALVETFASAGNRDPQVSGDVWANGSVQPVALGGDGRHGSFDHLQGTLNPATGEFEFNNDNFLVTAARSLTGQSYLINDGKYYFTDFVVPAGVKVRFLGSVPAQIFVRGQADIRGTIDVSAAEMPFWVPPAGIAAGQHVSNFDSRGFLTFQNGQLGGAPGCGGGRGGDGANECHSTGPDIVFGFPPPYNGRDGQDVRVPAGHAYGASTAGTGGKGGVLNPASGLTVNVPLMGLVYRAHFSQGGSGGGYSLPGGQSTGTPLSPAVFSPTSAPGAQFSLLPFPPAVPPPGYSALNHFLVGGSGGGGGGSHSFGTQGIAAAPSAPPNVYQAGHGGTGGGGAVAFRTGGSLTVANTGILRSKGGAGILITGDSQLSPSAPDINNGISSPGGGGSGGSFLLQSSISVTVNGTVDTGGGAGSRTGSVFLSTLNQVTQAGAGAPGFYRLEAGTVSFAGTGTPAFVAADNSGPLTDQDDRSGSRSLWLLPPTNDLPVWLRYELVVDIAGSPVIFSDDPTVSPLRADDPSGAVQLRMQGARLDPLTGTVVPSTIGPWRTSLLPGGESSINRDRAKVVRFDLALNKAFGTVAVRELRLFWR
ncbi:MAG TPA: kelch repeat-containing protein [Planctomycetota bacterium]|nr:kelch repeat-containing protein [Planctomycetota bacterium]